MRSWPWPTLIAALWIKRQPWESKLCPDSWPTEVMRLNSVYYFNLPNLGVICTNRGFPGCASGKEPTCQWRRPKNAGSIPGSGKSTGVGNGNPPQYSCLKNSMDKGAWQVTVHGTAKSWTQLATEPQTYAIITNIIFSFFPIWNVNFIFSL